MKDIIYWLWLALKNGAGGTEAVKLLDYFPGGARDIFEATPAELRAASACSGEFLRKLADHDLTKAGEILEFCFLNGIKIIPCDAPEYPRRLDKLHNKPIVLYSRGRIEDLNDRFCVAVIGTRNMTNYGKHMTFMITRQLIAYGAVIISGAAYGVDSAANHTAKYMESETVAVLGSGVNVPYPAVNKELLEWIGDHGMVVSEFVPNTPPHGKNFPIRNRIISGMADAVLVVEAAEKSGALLTARCAVNQHRRVYAIPGNVGATMSAGTNNLIRDGAKLVTRAEDIIEDFADEFSFRRIDHIINKDKYVRYEMAPQRQTQPASDQNAIKAEPEYIETYEERTRKNPPALRVGARQKAAAEVRSSEMAGITANTDADGSSQKPKSRRRPAEKPSAEPSFAGASEKLRVKPAEKSAAPQAEAAADRVSERRRMLETLGPVTMRIYDAMPDTEPINPDKLVQMGHPTDEVLSSLTMLEVYSAVEILPGGLYKKIL